MSNFVIVTPLVGVWIEIADFNGMEIRPVIAADIVTGTPKVCEELLTLIKEN